ncbi:hypothetical protein ANACOL_01810 [Anaerotruncus colihominis DSM 17241]|uniref:Uncharacterized protein n=1 Tax=Anaerotruncus colihominis DSM 17241 TaxID=445972 RepID=B0PAL0_9FIRM|nr:hypothetical protein ANACOL_01810 [Anaerotruncus colihominis DSM 17241]DAO23587.1 MAG TPA: hypothetical protein [Caudoviricetes sp.]
MSAVSLIVDAVIFIAPFINFMITIYHYFNIKSIAIIKLMIFLLDFI